MELFILTIVMLVILTFIAIFSFIFYIKSGSQSKTNALLFSGIGSLLYILFVLGEFIYMFITTGEGHDLDSIIILTPFVVLLLIIIFIIGLITQRKKSIT